MTLEDQLFTALVDAQEQEDTKDAKESLAMEDTKEWDQFMDQFQNSTMSQTN